MSFHVNLSFCPVCPCNPVLLSHYFPRQIDDVRGLDDPSATAQPNRRGSFALGVDFQCLYLWENLLVTLVTLCWCFLLSPSVCDQGWCACADDDASQATDPQEGWYHALSSMFFHKSPFRDGWIVLLQEGLCYLGIFCQLHYSMSWFVWQEIV